MSDLKQEEGKAIDAIRRLSAIADYEKTRADGWMKLKRERDEEREAITAERDALRNQAAVITKDVGASSLQDAFDTIVRTNAGHMDQVEQQFNKIKEMGRESQELRAERDAMREHIQNLEREKKECEEARDAVIHANNRKTQKVENLETEVQTLRGNLRLWHQVDAADYAGHPYEILRDARGTCRGVAVDNGETREVTNAQPMPVNGTQATGCSSEDTGINVTPSISTEYAKNAVKGFLGDTLYDAFKRGMRAEVINDLMKLEEERWK